VDEHISGACHSAGSLEAMPGHSHFCYVWLLLELLPFLPG